MALKTVPVTRSADTLIDALRASLLETARHASGDAPPVAILWTDAGGQWRSLVPSLRAALPELYTLGAYDPGTRSGPVIWLKCIVDRTLPEVSIEDDGLGRAPALASPAHDAVPVLYLPGVDRQQLRAAGDCPVRLQPLVELQYRGAVWRQRNGRDWTVDAFLASEYGLGLDVAFDAATCDALTRALPLLALEPVSALRGRRLEAEDFDRLAIGDPVRDLLSWMSDPAGFHGRGDSARWQTFRTVCMREFDLDPEQDGEQKAGGLLLEGGGKWDAVWQRFREAPKIYRGLSTLLGGKVKTLFDDPSRRPTANAEQEESLRRELEAAVELAHHDACERVLALEREHHRRREWVWAELGESPLATVLGPLGRLAAIARAPLGGPTLEAVAEAYATEGWRCDRAALQALSTVSGSLDSSLVARVVRTLYQPWLDKSARHFQSLAGREGANLRNLAAGVVAEKETCLLFSDGLRFDVAKFLQEGLEARGVRTRLEFRFAPLPTVTATAKPLASPAHSACVGDAAAENFTPFIGTERQEATAARLREELSRTCIAVLSTDDLRPPSRSDRGGWCEIGQLDQLGHSLGVRLARQIEAEVETIAERIIGLLDAGWSRVRVVTDHGWLLMPGGLPKVDLPHYLAATRWGRCATVKGESATSIPTYSWYWNPRVRIACPPGIGAFFAGTDYAHGGVSVQECVVPDLIAERGAARGRAAIQEIHWRGMRCRVLVETNAPGARVDIRLNRKRADSSIVAAPKELGAGGEASLAVADDAHEGAAATVVVLDGAGEVLDHETTTVACIAP
ncbi:MAG TPA: BREX-1 system phosphatase PglZ type B [Pirellulales bacterium]|nr:BREX-1 system phosphatase PglZ type B [Pirellulales bacterium]